MKIKFHNIKYISITNTFCDLLMKSSLLLNLEGFSRMNNNLNVAVREKLLVACATSYPPVVCLTPSFSWIEEEFSGDILKREKKKRWNLPLPFFFVSFTWTLWNLKKTKELFTFWLSPTTLGKSRVPSRVSSAV